MLVSRIIFILLLGVVGYFAFKSIRSILFNIRLGKPYAWAANAKPNGFKNMILVALGQQKMFARWIPAILHLFIYAAFIFTQIDLIEQVIDGVTGSHRSLMHILGGIYPLLISWIEILSVLAFVATIIFLTRRNLLRLPRFKSPEMKGWPFTDANLILMGEILLIIGIFLLNGADKTLQDQFPEKFHDTGYFAITSWLGPMILGGLSEMTLINIMHFGWWLHILVVISFLLYLPISKHLHIILAFPNTYFAPKAPRGEMENMPAIENEVKSMLGLPINEPTENVTMDFGAHDIFQLSQKNLLDAYTCTECGRCTSVCPANLTGKKLSPRKIMMDTRDRMELVGKNLHSNPDKYKSDQSDVDNKFQYVDG